MDRRTAAHAPNLRPLLSAWGLVGLWCGLIWILSGDDFSATTTSSSLDLLLRWFVPDLSAESLETINNAIRKFMHLALYGVLGALAFRAGGISGWRIQTAAWVALALAGAMASADETRQSGEPNRSGSAADVLIDLAGASLAIGTGIWKRRTSASEPTDRA